MADVGALQRLLDRLRELGKRLTDIADEAHEARDEAARQAERLKQIRVERRSHNREK